MKCMACGGEIAAEGIAAHPKTVTCSTEHVFPTEETATDWRRTR